MALFRLLVLKPPLRLLHIHKRGLSKSTRSEAASEQEAKSEEADRKNYMETHLGFSESTCGENKVGKSWYNLNGLLSSLKAKILGSYFQNETIGERTDLAANKTESQVNMTLDSQHNEIGGKNHGTKPSEAKLEILDSYSNCKENISTSKNSDFVGRNSTDVVIASELVETQKDMGNIKPGLSKGFESSKAVSFSESQENNSNMGSQLMEEYLVNVVASGISKVHTDPENSELGKSQSIAQSSEVLVDSLSNEKCVPVSASSYIQRKRSSENMDQLEVNHQNEQKQLEEAKLHRSCSTIKSPGEASTRLPKDGADGFLARHGNQKIDKKTAPSVQMLNGDSDVGKVHTSSDGSCMANGLAADLYVRTIEDQIAKRIASEKTSTLATPNEFMGTSNKLSGEDTGSSSGISSLVSSIQVLCGKPSTFTSRNCTSSNNTVQVATSGSAKKVADSQENDTKESKKVLWDHVMGKESNKLNRSEEQSHRGTPSMILTDSMTKSNASVLESAHHHKKSEASPKFHISIGKEGLDMNGSVKKGSTQNKLLIRFLNKNVDHSNIRFAFKDCGPIMKIQLLSSVKGSIFKDAYVYFKTREALQKALMKTDLTIGTRDVLMLPTCLEDVPKRISIPNLIGDPDVLVELTKNPSRTVMIKQLSSDISSDQLKEALGFCGSGISSFFFGSSSSVAYVEFEKEEAKDKALAKHTIRVQGKKLSIFRIDAPRTTVVRISNFDSSNKSRNIRKTCNSYGQVKNVFFRQNCVVDVHFKIAEWPKMMNILNSLNGLKVDNKQWIAQPAPVYPPEILGLLWTQPEERKHVIFVLRRLLQNLKEDSPEGTKTTNLAAKYHLDCSD